MVTFICSHCDTTLKKKQAQTHFGRCRPASFICIDCHVTFQGNDFRAHTSCLTEFEKHWGEYAKPKGKLQQNGQQKPAKIQVTAATLENEQSKKQDQPIKAVKSTQISSKEKKPTEESAWKGWKNEIKSLVKSQNNKIIYEDLQQRVLKRYRQFEEDEDLKDEELKQLFSDKLKKLKKIKTVTYVTLE